MEHPCQKTQGCRTPYSSIQEHHTMSGPYRKQGLEMQIQALEGTVLARGDEHGNGFVK